MNPDGSTVTGKHNSVSSVRNSNFNYTWESFANYSRSIAQDHHIDVVGGMSVAKTSGNQIGASKQDVPFNSWTFADVSAATGVNTADNTSANSGYYYEYIGGKNVSFFGRLNYDFRDKYLLSGSGRRDGSYSFGADKQWGWGDGNGPWVMGDLEWGLFSGSKEVINCFFPGSNFACNRSTIDCAECRRSGDDGSDGMPWSAVTARR